jgi:hypothetical protein
MPLRGRIAFFIGAMLALGVAACGKSPAAPGIQTVLQEPRNTFLDGRLTACPSQGEMDSVGDLPMTFFEPNPTGLVCHKEEGSADLTAAHLLLYRSLLMMKTLQFDAPLPWTSKSLYGWFHDTIGLLSVRVMDGTSSQGGRNVDLYINAPKMPFTWPSVETIIGGIVHETRHIEVGPHRCGTKDFRVDDLGAFGVHNFFLTFIGRHSDPNVIPVEYRPLALWRACTQRNSAFCNEPPVSCSQ